MARAARTEEEGERSECPDTKKSNEQRANTERGRERGMKRRR